MAKVKMSDISWTSTNVKQVFRKPMVSRTSKWLETISFTNKDLLDILEISEDLEYNATKREFYQRLILSQSGPFDIDVFIKYLDKLFHVKSLLHLLENSTGLSETNKLRWLDYFVLTSPYDGIIHLKNGNLLKYGIDYTKSPFNLSLAVGLVSISVNKLNISDHSEFLWSVLDTMTDTQIHEWYLAEVSKTYEKRAMFLLTYPNMPAQSIEHYYNKTNITNKRVLATYTNCPIEIKMTYFNETGETQYLPQTVQDVFLF